MDLLFGMHIIADDRFVKKVQARTHKKRRINKKWLKRYGYKYVPDSCVYFLRNGSIAGHPKTIEVFKRQIKQYMEKDGNE